MLVVDEKTQKESQFEKFVGDVFEKDAVVDDSNDDGLETLFKLEGTDIHLYLVFINNIEAVKKTKLPFGRTSYAESISVYLKPVYDELEKQSKTRIHKDESKLFEPGVQRLNKAGDLTLEEFYEEKFSNPLIKDTKPQDKLTQLVLSLGFPDVVNVSTTDFYKQAVKNLKIKAPALKCIRLDGGYAYNPEKIQSDDIKNEIAFFKDHLNAIFTAFKDADVNVSSVKLKVYWLSTKKDAEESGYPKLLNDAFGYQPTEKDIDSGRVLMVFQLQSIDVDAELFFFDEPPKTLPKGRISYYSAAKLLEAEQDKAKAANTEK